MTSSNLPRLFLATVVFVVCLPTCLLGDGGSSRDTQSVQAQLTAAQQQQLEAQKQLSLKRAAVEVEQKRAVELEKQLNDVKHRLNSQTKAVQAAEVQATAKTKQVASITKMLKQNQHADSLLAAATAAKAAADAAQAKRQSLTDQAAALKQMIVRQQQAGKQAAVDLQAAQKKLPTTTEELTKARKVFDAVAKELDVARAAVATARKVMKGKRADLQPEMNRLRKADAALAQVNTSINSLQDSLAAIQSAAKTAGVDPQAAGAELTQSIAAVKPLQKRAEELVAVAQGRIATAQKQVDASVAALKVAETSVRERQNNYATHSRSHFKLQMSVADLQRVERLHETEIPAAKAAEEKAIVDLKALEPQIAAAVAEFEKLDAVYVARQRVAETAMEPINRFVSFSKHIAPIFAKRCLACHNSRTAKGKLNMDSFAALAKGGESGAAFEGHDADSSLLLSMIEDGSMPKDADPLTKDEIALVTKWIDVGAPLDAGIIASADLFHVMPEIAQPLPPKTYRVPIPVTATAFNADASVLASSGYHEVLLWKTADGSLLRRITNVAERVYDLKFSSDGSQLVVAAGTPGQLGEVKLFSTADGKHLKTLLRTTDAVFGVAFSPDEKRVAAGGADHRAYVVDVASGAMVAEIEDHADWVMDVNWSPDGKRIVTSSRDKASKVFDVASGKSLVTFSGHGDVVYTAAFLADGLRVVSAGSDRQVRVWTVADGKEVRKIGGFGNDIFGLTVTADDHLFTACADRNAREHNLADGKIVRTFAGHKDWVYTLCYNAAKQLIATGSYDGEIKVWKSQDGSVATSFIAVPKADDANVASK